MSKTRRFEPAIARMSAALSIGFFSLLTSIWASAEQAPDYAAVQQRLDAAVIAGDITQEQAQERWDAFLRRVGMVQEHDPSRHPKQEHAPERRGDRYARAERRIKAAVAAGDMTEDQATKRLSRMKEDLAAQHQSKSVALSRLQSIREAVAVGDISQEDGEAAIRRVRERLARSNGHTQMKGNDSVYQGRLASIRDAVADGEITTEEGDVRAKALHQRMEAAKRVDTEHREARRAIREGIASGEMTREEGFAALQEMR